MSYVLGSVFTEVAVFESGRCAFSPFFVGDIRALFSILPSSMDRGRPGRSH